MLTTMLMQLPPPLLGFVTRVNHSFIPRAAHAGYRHVTRMYPRLRRRH